MTYEDIPEGIRSEFYFKALELTTQYQSLPFFLDGKTKEDLARDLAVKMYEQRMKKQNATSNL